MSTESAAQWRIIQAGAEHRAIVQTLFTEYLTWAVARLDEEYGITFDIPATIAGDMATLHKFDPPAGALLLAVHGDPAPGEHFSGLACVRRIETDEGIAVAELKRMYVRPAFRRQGIGRALVEASIATARAGGYPAIRLDSTRFMAGAHALYRGLGFQEIPPYSASEIPPEYRQHWVFMQRSLGE